MAERSEGSRARPGARERVEVALDAGDADAVRALLASGPLAQVPWLAVASLVVAVEAVAVFTRSTAMSLFGLGLGAVVAAAALARRGALGRAAQRYLAKPVVVCVERRGDGGALAARRGASWMRVPVAHVESAAETAAGFVVVAGPGAFFLLPKGTLDEAGLATVRGALAGPLRAAPPGADERRRVLRVAIAVAVGVAALVAALDAVGRVGAWTQRPGERPWATGR